MSATQTTTAHTTTARTIKGTAHASCSCGWTRTEIGLGTGGAVFMAEAHERAMVDANVASGAQGTCTACGQVGSHDGSSYCCTAPVAELVAAEAAAVAAAELDDAMAAEVEAWEAARTAQVAELAAASWCLFADCIHHLKPAPVSALRSPERIAEALTIPEASDPISAAIAGLTASGKEFMTAVGMKRFDFFDEGIVAGSGNWGENMSWQYASIAGKSARSVSGVMARLSTIGLWDVYLDGERGSDGNWWSLTELGAAVAVRLAEQNAAAL